MLLHRPTVLAFAHHALSHPPLRRFTKRPEPVGQLVWECVLPLDLCFSTNERDSRHKWAKARARKDVHAQMLAQHGGRVRAEVLPGRPCVHCVRFTSKKTDAQTTWSKSAVDSLIVPRVVRCKNGKVRRYLGLGFIVDDDEDHVDLHCWSEPAPPGKGFVLVLVYSGEVTR